MQTDRLHRRILEDSFMGGLLFHPKPIYSAEELLALYWKLRGLPPANTAATNATEEPATVSVEADMASLNGSKDEA
jgi:hypothetical protein